jgi:hypothetical protein
MVFWLTVGIAVVLVPSVAYGLVMLALFLYVRLKYVLGQGRVLHRQPERAKRQRRWWWNWGWGF